MTGSGIYTITNLIDGKIYVGSSIRLNIRKSEHFFRLKGGIHCNIFLQRAFNKHGERAFEFEILEECLKEFLASQEHYWCNLLRVHEDEFGYNIEPTNPNSLFTNSRAKSTIVKITARSQQIDNKIRIREIQKLAAKSRIGTHHTKESKLKGNRTKYGVDRIIEIFCRTTKQKITEKSLVSECLELTGDKPSSIRNSLCGISKGTRKFIYKWKIYE